METRANYVLIGLFTLLVVASAFGFVYWFARFGDTTERRSFDIVFPGSVTGLNTGSQVQFNGIRVGEVTRLSFDPDNPQRVIGRIRIDVTTPVRTDTRAQLEYQGITGVGYVGLTGGSVDAPLLSSEEGAPVIYAERSSFEDIVEGARDVLGQADGVLRRFDSLIAANEDAITDTVRNVETVTANLAEGSENLNRLMDSAGDFSEAFGALSGNLEGVLTNLEGIVEAIEPETVRRTLGNVEAFSTTLAESTQDVTDIMADVRQAVGRVNNILEGADDLTGTFQSVGGSAERLIQELDRIAQAVDAETVTRSINRFEEVMVAIEPDAVRNAISNVEQFSNTLTASSQDVTEIMANARTATERFNTLLEGSQELPQTIQSVAATAESLMQDLERITRAVDADSVSRSVARFEDLMNSVDPETVQRALANVEQFSTTLSDSSDDVTEIMANARTATARFNTLLEGAEGLPETFANAARSVEGLTGDLERVAAAVDPDQVRRTLANAEEFSETLSGNSERVNNIVNEANELATKLNGMADRVEVMLVRLDGYLEADGEGFLQEATLAAQSFRRLSEQLEGQVDVVLTDVSRFTGRGLRDFEAFVGDGRRTLDGLNRVISNLERNPRQFIFGGNSVPEYRGR